MQAPNVSCTIFWVKQAVQSKVLDVSLTTSLFIDDENELSEGMNSLGISQFEPKSC